MADQSERAARLLVRALYYATDGEPRWWVLPTNLNDMTAERAKTGAKRGRSGCPSAGSDNGYRTSTGGNGDSTK